MAKLHQQIYATAHCLFDLLHPHDRYGPTNQQGYMASDLEIVSLAAQPGSAAIIAMVYFQAPNGMPQVFISSPEAESVRIATEKLLGMTHQILRRHLGRFTYAHGRRVEGEEGGLYLDASEM